MEVLVNIKFARLAELPVTASAPIAGAERGRAADLATLVHLVRRWRVPFPHENWGLWSEVDATALHRLILGLPAYPWMHGIMVIPLAIHPADSTQTGVP